MKNEILDLKNIILIQDKRLQELSKENKSFKTELIRLNESIESRPNFNSNAMNLTRPVAGNPLSHLNQTSSSSQIFSACVSLPNTNPQTPDLKATLFSNIFKNPTQGSNQEQGSQSSTSINQSHKRLFSDKNEDLPAAKKTASSLKIRKLIHLTLS